MLSIKVLGPGCKNCNLLQEHALQAVDRWQVKHPEIEVSLEKVTDITKFLDYDLINTPGLVINEKLVSSGKIPAPSQIIAWMDEASDM